MPLQEMIVVRCREDLKSQLVDIAEKSGLSPSAFARGSLELVLMSKHEPSMLEQIIRKAKEQNKKLYVRANNDGHSEGAKE